jgi:hypothetical protein
VSTQIQTKILKFTFLQALAFRENPRCYIGVDEEEDREDEVVISCTLLPLAMRQK